MQQIFGIGAVAGTAHDLPQQIAPKLPTDRDVGHVSAPVIFPPDHNTIKTGPALATKIFSKAVMRKFYLQSSGEMKVVPAAITARRVFGASGGRLPLSSPMRTFLIVVAWLWLAAAPAAA